MPKMCVKAPFWLKTSIDLGKVAQLVQEYSFEIFFKLEYSFNRIIHFLKKQNIHSERNSFSKKKGRIKGLGYLDN